MRCNKAQNLISLAMDEPLAEFERLHLAKHLERCSPCVQYETDIQRVRVLLVEAEAAPPANFEWKVQLGIQKALREAASQRDDLSQRRRFWLPAGVSAVAVAAIVVFVGGVGVMRLSDDTVIDGGSSTNDYSSAKPSFTQPATSNQYTQDPTPRQYQSDWRTPASSRGSVRPAAGFPPAASYGGPSYQIPQGLRWQIGPLVRPAPPSASFESLPDSTDQNR